MSIRRGLEDLIMAVSITVSIQSLWNTHVVVAVHFNLRHIENSKGVVGNSWHGKSRRLAGPHTLPPKFWTSSELPTAALRRREFDNRNHGSVSQSNQEKAWFCDFLDDARLAMRHGGIGQGEDIAGGNGIRKPELRQSTTNGICCWVQSPAYGHVRIQHHDSDRPGTLP